MDIVMWIGVAIGLSMLAILFGYLVWKLTDW
jgi:hypothetical protein